MFSDNALLPKEALRLAILGLLEARPLSYGALASEVRAFVSRIAGPSIETMGSSIELLRYEGLVAPEGAGEDAPWALTAAGRDELLRLLRASSVRPPLNDLNKLVLALKLRFLHLLPPADQRAQAAMMAEACETELARLVDLRGRDPAAPQPFAAWLDHDIGLVASRRDWLRDFRDSIAAE